MAMLCVLALERHGVKPSDGDILVTGAAGGVGSVAVALLAKLGYTVAAVTGRPAEADYLRQMAIVSMAVNQLVEAMDLLERSQGGTALRESGSFHRRQRDFRAMPLHINVHQDRVTHQVGRLVLGIELDAF